MNDRRKRVKDVNFTVTDVRHANGELRLTACVQNAEDTDIATTVAGTVANVKELLATHHLTLTDVGCINIYLPPAQLTAAQAIAAPGVRFLPSSGAAITIEVLARI